MKMRLMAATMAMLMLAACASSSPHSTQLAAREDPWTVRITGMLIGQLETATGASCTLDVASLDPYDSTADVRASQHHTRFGGAVVSVAVELVSDYGLSGHYCVLRYEIPSIEITSNSPVSVYVNTSAVGLFDGQDYPSDSTLELVNAINSIGSVTPTAISIATD